MNQNIPQQPKIVTIPPKKLAGLRMKMSINHDRTVELWKNFMFRRMEIRNRLNENFYSLQLYDPDLDFRDFTPETEFEKWAAIEVSDFKQVPANFKKHVLTGGLYAVFNFKGKPETFPNFFYFIFSTRLPASGYELDSRAHFELLGSKYRRDDPESEEEIWIPVKPKNKFLNNQ